MEVECAALLSGGFGEVAFIDFYIQTFQLQQSGKRESAGAAANNDDRFIFKQHDIDDDFELCRKGEGMIIAKIPIFAQKIFINGQEE